MNAWWTTGTAVLGYGAVAATLQRAGRLAQAGRLRRGRASVRARGALGRLRLAGARRWSARRARGAAVPTYAEAVARELRAGCALPEAIALASDSVGRQSSPGLDVLIGLGSEVGGQLADAFDSLAAAARDDLELRDEVHALTAQSRASAILLTALPFGATALMGALQPSTAAFLLGTSGGWTCVGVAAVMLGVGWAWMGSMVRSV